MSGITVLVCGGRTFDDRDYVYDVLDELHADYNIARVVQGGARGADSLAHTWALSREIVSVTYPARWKKEGKSAGHRRNERMLRWEPSIELVVAFPGGPGTGSMIGYANRAGIPVLRFHGR